MDTVALAVQFYLKENQTTVAFRWLTLKMTKYYFAVAKVKQISVSRANKYSYILLADLYAVHYSVNVK